MLVWTFERVDAGVVEKRCAIDAVRIHDVCCKAHLLISAADLCGASSTMSRRRRTRAALKTFCVISLSPRFFGISVPHTFSQTVGTQRKVPGTGRGTLTAGTTLSGVFLAPFYYHFLFFPHLFCLGTCVHAIQYFCVPDTRIPTI